jgi:hypothetical protein
MTAGALKNKTEEVITMQNWTAPSEGRICRSLIVNLGS